MKCLKKVVNLSLANGWMTVNPFAGIKYAEKKVIREYLTMPEVNRLREKEFSIQRLEMVRDIFLFCCYTGLAYIDVHNLRPENITEDAHGRKWIRKQREKTDVEFYVPLLEYPLQILEKYKNHPLCKERGTLLPVYANQKMNSYLKEIADFCGIKKQLTMHIARHSISSFSLKNKRFTELEFAIGNDLETSKVLLSVLFCIIEKNDFYECKGNYLF